MHKIIKFPPYCNNIEDAINSGDEFYWDMASANEGKSGGVKCSKCRLWINYPRKRKYKLPTCLTQCSECYLIDEVSDIEKFTESLNELCKRISNIETKMVELLGKKEENLVEKQGKNDR